MDTVLVVDDEYAILTLVAELLEEEGYRVIRANDGEQALAQLASSPRPDVILSDVMMPGMDGRALCRTLAADPTYRDIPVVLMSAASEQPLHGTCPYAAFIAKPFDITALTRLVGKLAHDRQHQTAADAGIGCL